MREELHRAAEHPRVWTWARAPREARDLLEPRSLLEFRRKRSRRSADLSNSIHFANMMPQLTRERIARITRTIFVMNDASVTISIGDVGMAEPPIVCQKPVT